MTKHTHSTSPPTHLMKPPTHSMKLRTRSTKSHIHLTRLRTRLTTLRLRVKKCTRSTKIPTSRVMKSIPSTKILNRRIASPVVRVNVGGLKLGHQTSEWQFPLYPLPQGVPSAERKPFSPRVYWKVGTEGIQEVPLTPRQYPQSVGSGLGCCARQFVHHGLRRILPCAN